MMVQMYCEKMMGYIPGRDLVFEDSLEFKVEDFDSPPTETVHLFDKDNLFGFHLMMLPKKVHKKLRPHVKTTQFELILTVYNMDEMVVYAKYWGINTSDSDKQASFVQAYDFVGKIAEYIASSDNVVELLHNAAFYGFFDIYTGAGSPAKDIETVSRIFTDAFLYEADGDSNLAERIVVDRVKKAKDLFIPMKNYKG